MTALITRESAEELGLEPGQQVTALVKATDVMISTRGPTSLRTSSSSSSWRPEHKKRGSRQLCPVFYSLSIYLSLVSTSDPPEGHYDHIPVNSGPSRVAPL